MGLAAASPSIVQAPPTSKSEYDHTVFMVCAILGSCALGALVFVLARRLHRRKARSGARAGPRTTTGSSAASANAPAAAQQIAYGKAPLAQMVPTAIVITNADCDADANGSAVVLHCEGGDVVVARVENEM